MASIESTQFQWDQTTYLPYAFVSCAIHCDQFLQVTICRQFRHPLSPLSFCYTKSEKKTLSENKQTETQIKPNERIIWMPMPFIVMQMRQVCVASGIWIVYILCRCKRTVCDRSLCFDKQIFTDYEQFDWFDFWSAFEYRRENGWAQQTVCTTRNKYSIVWA